MSDMINKILKLNINILLEKSNFEAIYLLQNADLNKKVENYKQL